MTCLGCPNLLYCSLHHKQHRAELNTKLQVLGDKCNQFREEIEIQTRNSQTHPLMKTIDEWEKRAIVKIRKVAQETKEELLRYISNFIPRVKVKLDNLCTEIHQDPDDYEFMDIDIKNWTKEFEKLRSLLNNLLDLTIQEVPTEFINTIHVETRGKSELCKRIII